jgi:hypothetical protein
MATTTFCGRLPAGVWGGSSVCEPIACIALPLEGSVHPTATAFPAIALQRRHIPWPDPSPPAPARPLPASRAGMSNVPSGAMRDHRIGRALQPDQAGQRAGIDARKPDPAIRWPSSREMLGRAEIARGWSHPRARSQPTAAGWSPLYPQSFVPTLPICGKVKLMICPA